MGPAISDKALLTNRFKKLYGKMHDLCMFKDVSCLARIHDLGDSYDILTRSAHLCIVMQNQRPFADSDGLFEIAQQLSLVKTNSIESYKHLEWGLYLLEAVIVRLLLDNEEIIDRYDSIFNDFID